MTKILRPRERKINETEEVAMPLVRCGVCGNLTAQGLHQIRLRMVRPARLQRNKITGTVRRIPPVMKREDVYLCTNCVTQKKKWPGRKP